MLSIAQLLYKTVVRKFYERNTGFFLFLFFFLFGIVESTQIVYFHLSLITGIINSTLFFLLICLLWIFYLIKCFAFVSGYFEASENSFLQEMNKLTLAHRISALLYIFVLIYLPVLLYSTVIIGVAVSQMNYWIAILIAFFHTAALVIASFLLNYKISSLKPPTFQWPTLTLNIPLPYPLFYLKSLTHQFKAITLITKVFSFFSIIGFMNIPLDHYEYRTALMGFLFGLAAHAVIVFEFRKLEDQHLAFLRQLPLPFLKRFGYLVGVYGIILIPELVLILFNRINLVDTTVIYFGGISFLIFCHCALYSHLDMDKHILRVLMLFLLGFGLTLFRMAWPGSVFLFFGAYYLFQKNYFRYEASSNLSPT